MVTRVDGDLVGVVKLLVLDFVEAVVVVDGDLVPVEKLLVVALICEVVGFDTVVEIGLFEVVKVRVLVSFDVVVVCVLTLVDGDKVDVVELLLSG